MQDKDALIFSTELLHTFTILAINTGSTSTKMAVYRNRTPVVELCVTHRTDEIERFETLTDQVEWRKGIILSTLADNDIDPTSFSAVIGRGGLLRPIESGVYEVNELMIDELRHCTPQHASNLSAIIADEIAQQCGVKAYIADPVVVDERIDVAKMCGVAQIRRRSVFHALNQKATARIYAERVGRPYEELNLVVAHMGGGISVAAHRKGRVIDVNNALEVIRKAEKGEKIEYATLRNRRQTSEMKEQMPKHYFVANEIRQHPSRKDKTIVIVIDPASKTADVILPAGASADVDNEIPGMNKARIGRALRKEGIEQVRFYNTDGALGYRPDDSYFAEKQVALARMKNWTMEMLSTLNVDEAVRRAHEVGFDRVQMIQDDKNRWALYLKPENRSGYSIYPDKEDVNRFFSTFKQAMDNIDKVRMELAHKYYALAETQPDLKVDLFGSRTRETDLNRIQRVSVFKTKTDGILCAATIDGTKVQPRSVTPQQWQRMWVAEDRDSYKRHLAATLFADVLRKGQTQEENTGEKQEKEHLQRQGEKATPKRTDDVVQESASPRNGLPIENLPEPLYGRYKEIKDELPEAIVLFKHEGSYYASMYDAETIANELNLPPQKERLAYDPDKMILAFEHDDEETRTQILSLRAFTIDCAAPGLQQETGEQNENEQHPTFRR